MTTWWKIPTRYIEDDAKPTPVETTGETGSFVICKDGRRVKKVTDWYTLHPTKEAAWATLTGRAVKAVDHARNSLEHREEVLAKLLAASRTEPLQTNSSEAK